MEEVIVKRLDLRWKTKRVFFFFFPIKPGESEIETTAKRTKQIKSNIFALGFLLKRVRTEAVGWEGPTDCGIRKEAGVGAEVHG